MPRHLARWRHGPQLRRRHHPEHRCRLDQGRPAPRAHGRLQPRQQPQIDWRIDFDVESLGATPEEAANDETSASHLDAQIAEGNAWVAVAAGTPVSFAAFNAVLPDIVQLGGIFTPREHRGRGYARASVAGSLLIARQRGANRAVLFTKNPNAARSYEAVGFRRIGDYGLLLLAPPA